jgi:hypothetical protein
VSELEVVLELKEPVVVGLSTLAAIRVIHRGKAPVTISSRLNLMEGDVRLFVGSRAIGGWQADTMLRQATLSPGQQIVGFLNLLYTESGPTFPEPGSYVLRAEFSPSPRMEPVASEPVTVAARLPQGEDELQAAALLKDDAVKKAIVLAQKDEAPGQLEKIAAIPRLLDGHLASLIVSGDAKTFPSADPLELASWIVALTTPYGDTGKLLAERFAQVHKGAKTASSLVKGEPLDESGPVL